VGVPYPAYSSGLEELVSYHKKVKVFVNKYKICNILEGALIRASFSRSFVSFRRLVGLVLVDASIESSRR
jgi:hypothetical protein